MTSYDLTDGREPVSHAEIDYLKSLAWGLRENPVVVQIGAATGVFTVALLEERPGATLFSIDIEPCPEEFENVRKAGLDATRVIRLLGRSEEIGCHFPYQCDLLFVDGDHFGAAKDFRAWRDKVRPGGVVAFHDYMEACPPNNPGCVYADVKECLTGIPPLGRAERVIAFGL